MEWFNGPGEELVVGCGYGARGRVNHGLSVFGFFFLFSREIIGRCFAFTLALKSFPPCFVKSPLSKIHK